MIVSLKEELREAKQLNKDLQARVDRLGYLQGAIKMIQDICANEMDDCLESPYYEEVHDLLSNRTDDNIVLRHIVK